MTTRDTTLREPITSSAERRIDRALRHVGDYWIPVNGAVLDKIQRGLKDGHYEGRNRSLVEDIRSDVSLFGFCLRKLIQTMRSNEEPFPQDFNPVALLEARALDELKEILGTDRRLLSPHAFDTANELQVARFQEMLVSASTAEVLAEKYDVDPDTAYSAAILRQLGLALIAWNYPGVYEQAMTSLKPGEQLDVVLAQKLGFSPGLLAVRVMHSWGLPAEARLAMGVSNPEDDVEQAIMGQIGNTVAKLCRVGEALARANDPKHYPESRDDWELAKREIETTLGVNGMSEVRERYLEHIESYLTVIPEVFHAGLILDPQAHQAGVVGEAFTNPYLTQCAPKVQLALRTLYSVLGHQMTPDKIQTNIRTLVHEVIPRAEFVGGAVYTADPGVMMLVPQVKVGEMGLRAFEAVDYSISASTNHPIAVAYQTNEPVIEYGESSTHPTLSGIASYFGHSQRMGVLYLEVPEVVPFTNSSLHLVHFKAIAHALNHCLNLR